MQNDKTPEEIAEATVRQYITAPFARDQMDPRELIAGLGLSNAQAASIFDMVVDAIERQVAECTDHEMHFKAERDALEEQMQDREMLVMLLLNAERQRDAALAVIKKARSLHYPHENPIHTEPALVCAHRHCVDDAGDQMAWPCPTGRILSSAPADVLRERDADRWDEGAKAASPYGGAYLRSILIGNPYRQTEEENSNG